MSWVITVILANAGFINDEELFTYGKNDTFLPGHPVINKQKGLSLLMVV